MTELQMGMPPQLGSSMAGFATLPRAPPQQQQQNGPMGSMAPAGAAAFPANFSNNGKHRPRSLHCHQVL